VTGRLVKLGTMARLRESGDVRIQTFGLLISSDDEIDTLVGGCDCGGSAV
jgi:hypothetical protein